MDVYQDIKQKLCQLTGADIDRGLFTAEVTKDKDDSAVASIVLYEFEDGELKLDGRLAPTIPLYN